MAQIQTLLQSALELSRDDKLRLVQDLWDDLAANPEDVPVYDWQIREMERRKADFAKNPAAGLTLDEFKRAVERDAQ